MTQQPATIALRDPFGSELEEWHGDLLLPSIFLVAATFILALINPIHFAYLPRPVETMAAVALASGLVIWGLLREKRAWIVGGSGLLLALVSLCLMTQPHQLGLALGGVWPLRMLLLILVVGSWAFLLRPPMWLRRALMAGLVTVAPLLLCTGGSLVLAQLATIPPIPAQQFSPYWLATDSEGRLYATASAGGYIMIFAPDGVPLGTIRPHLAAASNNDEPGFRPVAFPTPTPEIHLSGAQIGQPVNPTFTVCGFAIDGQDRLYVVDPTRVELHRLNRDGVLEKRFALPDGYQSARGCLAADDDHIYFTSRYGFIYIMDMEGRTKRAIEVDYQPFGIAPDGRGNLLVIAPNHIDRIEIETGEITLLPNPPPLPGGARAPFQSIIATLGGEIMVNDLANARVVRIAPEGGRELGTIGEPGSVQSGYWPGDYGGLGGLTQDKWGRIFVADWQLSVIQRFSPDGTLEAILTAPGDAGPVFIGTGDY